MKILFLQNIGNVVGGVANVNNTLATSFANDNNDVYIYAIRNGTQISKIEVNNNIHYKIINEKDVWNCPRYSEAIKNVKNGQVIKAFQKIKERILYNKGLKKDYHKLKEEILKINPDIIIVSHYELLDAIPKQYYKRTINHYHTNFGQILQNRTQIKILKKYKNKIKKYVWLTQSTYNEAVNFGIKNSVYIYNPIPNKPIKKYEDTEKKLVFLARFSEEKRLDLAIDIFNEVINENNLTDWNLDLYLVGNLTKEIEVQINKSSNISYKGENKCPEETLGKYYLMMMTSSFEGFPLTVIEAARCGVPTISFDFGESANEVITNDTGILINQNEKEKYKQELLNCIQNNQLRDKLSRNCKEFAEDFLVDNIKIKWYEIFEERDINS